MENALLTGKKAIILVMVEGKFMSTCTVWRAVSLKVSGG
jgi:hypothetical protein